LIAIWAATLVLGLSSHADGHQDRANNQAAIAGTWTLSRDLSDDPGTTRPSNSGPGRSGVPGAPGGRRGGGGGGGGGGSTGGRGGSTSSGVSDSSDATSALNPEYMRQASAMLVEVLEEPGEMTIAVGDQDVTFKDGDRVQRFKTDNSKQKIQLHNGTAETKVKWDHGKLLRETSLLGLATVKQFYSLDPSGNLEVDVRVERVRVADPFLFKLVYVHEVR
jgi:hypothetical protein